MNVRDVQTNLRTKNVRFLALLAVFVLPALRAPATVHYVNFSCGSPTAPYTNWVTAATNIQDAVNIALNGDTVLVTNGLYQFGGYSGSRVYIPPSSMTVQSVNGPAVTSIQGYQVPGTTNGSSAIRCVYMSSGSTLSGFTLTQGATTSGGGQGGGVWCSSQSSLVTNCVIAGNAGAVGGGAYSGTLVNCKLTNNIAFGWGGGANGSILINCLLVGNRTDYRGGAAMNCALSSCTVATNIGQTTSIESCKLTNCISYYNAPDNSSIDQGNNYYNRCCTIPLPSSGVNTITNPPAFLNLAGGDFHLSPVSPCINAGSNSFVVSSTDLDGNPRIVFGTVDIGAYESPYNIKVHYVSVTSTNPITPFNGWSIAATNIQDAVDAATNGDTVLVTNGLYQFGGRTANGFALTNRVAVTKPIALMSVNGAAATLIQGKTPRGGSAIRCVYLTNGAALSGFTLTNGGTLTSGNSTYEISGGGLLCESTKAVVSNCVVIGCSAANGGGVEGGALNGCAITRNSASYGGGVYGSNQIFGGATISNLLNNCLITSNYATSHGGGAFGSTLNNCLISSNSTGLYTGGGAAYSILNGCVITNNAAPGYNGGGVSFSALANCLVIGNRSGVGGGGAYYSALINCTVAGNSLSAFSGSGGGVASCTNYNSIIYDNSVYDSASHQPNYSGGSLTFCDTTPMPSGLGNITNDPAFVNPAGGDFHLQTNSPCINSGKNAYVSVTSDLDGNVRILGGTVDIGAYEYQSPSSVLSYAWAQQYGLPTDGSADYLDSDGDGMNNWQEWIAGTIPTNAASLLLLASPSNSVSGVMVTWQSVSGVTYYLQSSTNLSAQPVFFSLQSNIVGQAGSTSYTDTAATNGGPYFYRVGVQK